MSKKNQESRSRQRKITMKWGTFVTPTMSYKILGMRNLEREIVS